ncbi:hypothetical protein JWG42_18765, partial [Desulfoprunum benzoelyticum]
MIFQPRFFLTCLAFLALALPVGAWAEEPYDITLQAFRTSDAQAPVLAVLTLTPNPGWHAYGNIQGPSGFPTEVEASRDGELLTP